MKISFGEIGIIISGILVALMFVFVATQSSAGDSIGTVEDILDVSAGGFGTSDKCLYVIDGEKMLLRTCRLQIGDEVCEYKSYHIKCNKELEV